METLRKKLWALFFLIIFMPSLYSGDLRAASEAAERPGQKSFKIVGGEIVNPPGAYPWTAQIGYHRPPPNEHVFNVWCGGALIDRSWVLTAAHCFDDTVGSRYILTLGEHDLNQDEGTEQIIPVQEVIVHPNYNPSTSDNDIALLRLSHPANLDTRVNTIELGDLPTIGTPLTVVGWGTTTQGGAISNKLLETAVPLRTDIDCRNAYPGEITNTMFCAGFDGGGTDSCQGDSGGPIFFNAGGVSRQIGVVSWGRGCAQANFFGVYTHVARFTEWLNTSMRGVTNLPTPNVMGQAQTNAEAAIVSAGLTVGTLTTAHHQSVPKGNVISQNPTEGTMVEPGSMVDLVVSLGPDDVVSNIIPISPPLTEGSISEAGMVNRFQFTVANQGSFTIETNGTSNGMDTVMSLFESNNQSTPLEQNDDIFPGNVNSRITTTLSPGTYVIKVRHYHATQVGTYTIFVQTNQQ